MIRLLIILILTASTMSEPLIISVRPPDRVNVLNDREPDGAYKFYETVLNAGADGAILSQWEKSNPFFGSPLKEASLHQDVQRILNLFSDRGKFLDLAVAKLTKHDYGFRQGWPVTRPSTPYSDSLQWHGDASMPGKTVGVLFNLPQNHVLELVITCKHPTELRLFDEPKQWIISKYLLNPGRNVIHLLTCEHTEFALHFRANTTFPSPVNVILIRSAELRQPWYTEELGYHGPTRQEIRDAQKAGTPLPNPGFWQCEDPDFSNPDALSHIRDHIIHVEHLPFLDGDTQRPLWQHRVVRHNRVWSDEPKNLRANGRSPFKSAGAEFAYAVAAIPYCSPGQIFIFDGDAFSPSHNGGIISRTNSTAHGGMSTANSTLNFLLGRDGCNESTILVAWQEDSKTYPSCTSPLFRDLTTLAALPVNDVVIGIYLGIQNLDQAIADITEARALFPNRKFNQIELLSWDYSQFTQENLETVITYLREGLE